MLIFRFFFVLSFDSRSAGFALGFALPCPDAEAPGAMLLRGFDDEDEAARFEVLERAIATVAPSVWLLLRPRVGRMPMEPLDVLDLVIPSSWSPTEEAASDVLFEFP
mmetsp:Transcript_58430/g.123946  ORF Transcript_58430/g.123946 Transcript_58430/m.123946 type:complete len:107 (+) Transcript_58430:1393-1713(+)